MANFFIWFCIVSVLFLPDGIYSEFQKRNSVDDANEYIDRLLDDTIEENKHKLEPYRPGNMSFGFEYKLYFVKVTGKVELHDVSVTGISTVHRDGDCIRSSEGDASKISVNLGMGVLHLNSKARVSFMDYGLTVDLDGKIGYVLVHLEASGDNNADTPPSLDDFKIYDTKGEEATISGLGPLNYVANIIIPYFLKFFKGTILSSAEQKLKVALDEMIKTSNFPLVD